MSEWCWSPYLTEAEEMEWKGYWIYCTTNTLFLINVLDRSTLT